MLPLVLGGLQEQRRDLLVAFLPGHGSEVGVLVSGTGFAVEGGVEILLGLGACVFAHIGFLLLFV